MSAFDTDGDDIITVHGKDWDTNESCQMRTVIRAGDEEWVLNQLMQVAMPQGKQKRGGSDGMDLKSQLGATKRLWVQRMLQSWTFTRGGLPMPISGESLKLLKQSYIDDIYNALQARQPKTPELEVSEGDEEGTPFFGNVSTFTAGDIDTIDGEELMQDLIAGPVKRPRNHLSRS